MIPTVDDLKKIQRDQSLEDFHVVWIGPSWFVIAHTDLERRTIDLRTCSLHDWLRHLPEAPVDPGYYIVTPHAIDANTGLFDGGAPYDFEPLVDVPRPTGS